MTADKIVITRNGKDVTFTKAGGNWKMTQPIATDAEDEALRELHDALARLRAEEIVAEKPADLKQYGLDKPETLARLQRRQGSALACSSASARRSASPASRRTASGPTPSWRRATSSSCSTWR